MPQTVKPTTKIFTKKEIDQILEDYRICCMSRECSVLARKEVLTGKAKFGIIGDGKELPQVALASVFQKGDWRSGYYRDQTLMFSLGLMTVAEFFAQLYADPAHDKFTAGRSMNCHFLTPTINPKTGNWLNHKALYNVSADISPTAGQMARGLGIAYASKKYRHNPEIANSTEFSTNGNEVSFVTIGDASTSEGIFWESLNAAGVLQVPMVISVWDDGYGISVPKKYQTTKQSISEVLLGFQSNVELAGIDIYRVKAWDYPALLETYQKAAERARKHHIPALVHVEEVTQQLGHSTSGDHRRYKSASRLQFEIDQDCNLKFKNWILENSFSTEEDLAKIESAAILTAREGQIDAYKKSLLPAANTFLEATSLLNELKNDFAETTDLVAETVAMRAPFIYEIVKKVRQILFLISKNNRQTPARQAVEAFMAGQNQLGQQIYRDDLYSNSEKSALKIPEIKAIYSNDSPIKNGFEILNTFFDAKFSEYPNLYAFGEDVGNIGDVNQGLAGLQLKYGKTRVFDTGIREWSIMGQAIGMAMRGLRPIAEIQYLDYLLYGISPLSDDLACLRWRTAGQQIAPAIIRTRGHRLEGVWHTGSPMSMMLGALRGLYICVPRNMTQAAGMYQTLLKSDDPAIVVECLNGYRLKEKLPDNVANFSVPLGISEIINLGNDLTIVTYGSCVRVAQDACEQLELLGISAELIDCQTLIPFDLNQSIVESLKKTNRLVVFDEDVPGGASAYILQQILEKQGGYRWLDSAPRTITAAENRGAYGSDGDYFCKPSAEDLVELVLKMMAE